jgi:hypothetical protein
VTTGVPRLAISGKIRVMAGRDESHSNAIERASRALRLADVAASMTLPATALIMKSPALLATILTLLWGARMSTARARRIVRAVAKNPDAHVIAELLRNRFMHPDREAALWAVRELLRGIEDALDPSVTEPLMRVVQLLNAGEISPRRAETLVRAIRSLSLSELVDLRRLLSEALAASADDPLRLAAGLEYPRDAPKWTKAYAGTASVPLSNCPSAVRLFRLLADADLGHQQSTLETGVDYITANGTSKEDPAPIRHDINLNRATAELLLRRVLVD